MSSKGRKNSIKAVNAPKTMKIKRKEKTWVTSPIAGTHKKNSSIPLGVALRDLLGVTNTAKETKNILSKGLIKVDLKVRKNPNFGIGLMDLIEIEKEEKKYRVLVDKKGRLFLKEVETKNEKLVRIEHKISRGKEIQITTNDGKLFKGVNGKIGDSIKLNLEKNEVKAVLELKKGCEVYITTGVGAGIIAEVQEIIEGTVKREITVILKNEEREFTTVKRKVIVIDKEIKEEILK